MSCSTTTSECDPSSDRNSSAVRSVSSSVMPATGSSSSSSFGSCISSMPISSHCFWPCDRSPAMRAPLSRRWISLSISPMRSLSCVLSRCISDARTRRSILSASSRFSNTESCSNTVGFWNLRPMPRPAISLSRRRSRSMFDPKNARPLSGLVLPVMTSIIVVLPAPLGPMMQRSSPTAMLSVSLFNARKPSKDTVMSSTYRMPPCAVSTSSPTTRPNAAWPPEPSAELLPDCFARYSSRRLLPSSCRSGVISRLPSRSSRPACGSGRRCLAARTA